MGVCKVNKLKENKMKKMEINPTGKLSVCGGSYPNEGDCVEIQLTSHFAEEPFAEKKRQEIIQILKKCDWQEQYTENGYYGGDGRCWYFPHDFYNQHPTIPFDIRAANEKATRKVEAKNLALPRFHKVLFCGDIRFPVSSLHQLSAAIERGLKNV